MAEMNGNPLTQLSNNLAEIVERVGTASLVRVDDGSRLTATGVVWPASGPSGGGAIVATTSHGLERDEELAIVTHDGTRKPATLIGRDPGTDVALLLVADGGGLTPATLAEADGVRVGNLALALARPGAAGLQATIGIVSSRQESETNGEPGYILTTDAVLYPGFSGGALVDTEGRVAGLLNRLYGRGAGVAIGAPVVSTIANLLLAHGRIPRGYLGVRMQLVSLGDSLRVALGLVQERGLLLIHIENGSPAEKGGLLLGDTLLQIDGKPVQDVDDLRRFLPGVGQAAALTIIRGGKVEAISVTVGAEE